MGQHFAFASGFNVGEIIRCELPYCAVGEFGLGINEKGRHVSNRKRKLTTAEKRAKRERKKNYMTIFINGKQKRVPRPQLIDGLPVDEFIARNADPIWLHQNEMWELMTPNNEG